MGTAYRFRGSPSFRFESMSQMTFSLKSTSSRPNSASLNRHPRCAQISKTVSIQSARSAKAARAAAKSLVDSSFFGFGAVRGILASARGFLVQSSRRSASCMTKEKSFSSSRAVLCEAPWSLRQSMNWLACSYRMSAGCLRLPNRIHSTQRDQASEYRFFECAFEKCAVKYGGAHSMKSPWWRGASWASRRAAASAMRCALRVSLGSSMRHLVDSSRQRPVSRSRYLRIQNEDLGVCRKNAMASDSHMLPHASTKIVWDKVGERCFAGVCVEGNSLPLHHEAVVCFVFEALAGDSHTAPTKNLGVAGVQRLGIWSGGAL